MLHDKTPDDAPAWMDPVQRAAWATGWNAATAEHRALLAAAEATVVAANDDARCQGTSWRGGSGQKAGVGYGPGGFNRCIYDKTDPHTRHVDEWGNEFVLEPKFRVVGHRDVVEHDGRYVLA
jgi:hypothetical protein